jgi:hypothetical protein
VNVPVRWVGLASIAVLLAACATPPTELTEIGSGAYQMIKRTELLSDRSDKLKAQAEEQALAFCAKQGRALTILDSKTIDPDPPAYATATIRFRCVARTP